MAGEILVYDEEKWSNHYSVADLMLSYCSSEATAIQRFEILLICRSNTSVSLLVVFCSPLFQVFRIRTVRWVCRESYEFWSIKFTYLQFDQMIVGAAAEVSHQTRSPSCELISLSYAVARYFS
ncbi:unnamed protein product [Victoria cruziana]